MQIKVLVRLYLSFALNDKVSLWFFCQQRSTLKKIGGLHCLQVAQVRQQDSDCWSGPLLIEQTHRDQAGGSRHTVVKGPPTGLMCF